MKITSSKEVYRCGLFYVTEDEAKDKKTGFEIKRSVVRHNGSAVMMAVDDKDRILLVRQMYRSARPRNICGNFRRARWMTARSRSTRRSGS